MTLNQIADSIADAFNRSLDVAFKERIKFSVNYWRARFIKQEIDKGNFNDLFQQTIVVPLETVDIVDDCAIDAGCPVLRSTLKVPQPVRGNGTGLFGFVGAVNGKVRFDKTTIESLPIKLESRYGSKAIYYDYRNEYLYVYNNTKLEFASVRGIFADLDKVKQFKCGSANCYSDDDDYPLPADLVALIVNGMLSNELRITGREDKEVDIDVEERDAD